MKFDFAQKSLAKLNSEKQLVLWIAAGLTLANLITIYALLTKPDKIILIPEFNTDHRLHLTGGEYDDQYYIDWADSILKIALTVSPHSVDWRNQQILKIATHSHGSLKKVLDDNAERVKKNHISTVFYPKSFQVHHAKKFVLITGQHLAFIGKDSRPVIQDRSYEVHWSRGPHGIVFVKDLIERKGEPHA